MNGNQGYVGSPLAGVSEYSVWTTRASDGMFGVGSSLDDFRYVSSGRSASRLAAKGNSKQKALPSVGARVVERKLSAEDQLLLSEVKHAINLWGDTYARRVVEQSQREYVDSSRSPKSVKAAAIHHTFRFCEKVLSLNARVNQAGIEAGVGFYPMVTMVGLALSPLAENKRRLENS